MRTFTRRQPSRSPMSLPAAQIRPPLTPWGGECLKGGFVALRTSTLMDPASNFQLQTYVVAADGEVSVAFKLDRLMDFLGAHPQTLVVYDLPGLLADPRIQSCPHFGEIRTHLEARVVQGAVKDIAVYQALHLIATVGEARDKDMGITSLPDADKILAAHKARVSFGRVLDISHRSRGGMRQGGESGDGPKVPSRLHTTCGEAHLLLEACKFYEGSLREVHEAGYMGMAATVPQLGLSTHNLQVRAALVLRRMSAEGVAFDATAHHGLVTHAWEAVVIAAEALSGLHWGLVGPVPPCGTDFHLGDLIRRERVASAINIELSRVGAGIYLGVQDLAGGGLKEAAYQSSVAHGVLVLREAVTGYKLCEPRLSGSRIRPVYHPLLATGRASSRGPNIQGFSRKSGIRSCVVARDGHSLLALDYSQMEIVTTAAVCVALGYESHLAAALRGGQDVHDLMASHLEGLTPQEFEALKVSNFAKHQRLRQCAKMVNFGVAAGMGLRTLMESAREAHDIVLCEDEARFLLDTHAAVFPEVREYVASHRRAFEHSEDPLHVTTLTGRTRLCGAHTDALITRCQGLGADGALLALCNLEAAGLRPVVFVHDEIVLEVRDDEVLTTASKASAIMKDALAFVLGCDIPVHVKASVGRTWGDLKALA